MPIEIKELKMKISILEHGSVHGKSDQAMSKNDIEGMKNRIIQECLKKVWKKINQKNER